MTAEESVERGLADRILRRDVDWDALYAEQLPRVYNFFRFRIRNTQDIEDLTSRTFEKAWRARQQYRRDRAGFASWLFGIARNVAADHLRSSREHISIDAIEAPEASGTPEGHASQQSDIARLAKLAAHLSDRDRELLALKYGAAINNRLIAELTGLSESNVGTILHRTVEKLRGQWERGD
jgi:RNA polymerase sigma-70 factor, ECF subfamily